jgi:hypothetical protein
MARQCGLSQSTVSRIWRAFSWQPHRRETFKLSPDPLFIDKVRDIVGLHLNPPDQAWCCAWMRRRDPGAGSQSAAVAHATRASRAAHPRRRAHGTASLFAALDAKSGTVIGQLHWRQRSIEFRKFLDTIDAAVRCRRTWTSI